MAMTECANSINPHKTHALNTHLKHTLITHAHTRLKHPFTSLNMRTHASTRACTRLNTRTHALIHPFMDHCKHHPALFSSRFVTKLRGRSSGGIKNTLQHKLIKRTHLKNTRLRTRLKFRTAVPFGDNLLEIRVKSTNYLKFEFNRYITWN